MELLRLLEAEARSRLPEPAFDYFAGGAGDERSLREHPEAWRRWWLRPRQLAGVAEASTEVELLGRTLAAPVVVAPMAAQRLLHPDGEVASARAAAARGLAHCLSTRSTASVAEVAAAVPDGERWFQLYVDPDRERVARVLARAAECGCTHVVLTADFPVPGRRERELRHGEVAFPPGVTIAPHLEEAAAEDLPLPSKPPVGGWAPLTWDDVGWAAEASGLPVLVKGVLRGDDARRAVDAGAAGVVVSAHGGRQLDSAVPPAVALPEVVEAVGGAVPVLVDGGIRSGEDVAVALALGAAAVLVGRPVAWGLACGGEEGAGRVLDALVEDLARTLVLLGCAGPGELRPDHLTPRL